MNPFNPFENRKASRSFVPIKDPAFIELCEKMDGIVNFQDKYIKDIIRYWMNKTWHEAKITNKGEK